MVFVDFIVSIFQITVFKPLLNTLILLYSNIPGADLGIAIVALTVLIRVVLYPLSHKALRSQKALAELQPKIKELQDKFKDRKEEQAKAIMQLYQKEKVNPFSGCAPLLLQLPFLFALFRLFRLDFGDLDPDLMYSFVAIPETINTLFLGVIDLAKDSSKTTGGIILAFSAGAAQFIQSKMLMAKRKPGKEKGSKDTSGQFANMMQTQMTYFMPIFTVVIVWNLSAGLALYWLVTTLFSILQQWFINRGSGTPKEAVLEEANK